MTRSRFVTIFILAMSLVPLITSQGFGDVSPGEVLDQTNWEKAKGVLPEPVLNWIKNGAVVLDS